MTSFITTPIFYASGEPHLGHAYSGIIADTYHRFWQLTGKQNTLITGTDEHGLKILSTAETNGIDVTKFVDSRAASFARLWPELNIQPDIFIRTTNPDHKAHVSKTWQQLFDNDDIYPGTYSGEYCVACEQYYPEYELDETLCPVHKKPVLTVTEDTYLFRLEKYRKALLDYYQNHPDLITPRHFQKSIIAQLQQEPLEDLSVSRINNAWGIKVPNDYEHTIYVWIDALFSYITAIQQSEQASTAIAQATHVIGKDILKFHAIYWPAFLLALNLPLPEKLVVHGWWTIAGNKISKSNPETTINPINFSQQLTVDGLRYALLRQKPLSRDGNVDIAELAEVINTDLANNLANLAKRNNTLALKHFDGNIGVLAENELDGECRQLLASCQQQLNQVIQHYKTHDLYQVALTLKQLLDQLNQFFHHRSPWLINKSLERAHVRNTCYVVANCLREVALSYLPIVPQLAGSILTEFGIDPAVEKLSADTELRKVAISSAKSHFNRVQVP